MLYIKKEDLLVSLRDLSGIVRMTSFIMLLPIVATFYYAGDTPFFSILESTLAFIIPSIILHVLYEILKRIKPHTESKTKHIMLTVALAWGIIALVGATPFIMRGILNPVDALFESMSGWTTTGFSMIRDIEGTSKDLLLYRGIMQGAGGLGVISLGVMVMFFGGKIGVGYVDMGVQRLKTGIRSTIKEVWKIYLFYIFLGVVLLYIAGMNVFDALNHSMAALATGGFSTHSDIGYYKSFWIESVLVLLMLAGGTSFLLHFKVFNGGLKMLWKNTEIKFMFGLIILSIIVISISIYGRNIPGVDTTSVFDVVWKTTFHVVAGMSTCGFNTIDFGKWPEIAQSILVVLMYIGMMSGSTAGGIRVIRFVILAKSVSYGLRKLILPKSAINIMKVNEMVIGEKELVDVIGYSVLYFLTAIVGSIALMFLGYTSLQSIFTIMSSIGNDGLGVISGTIWYSMPWQGKMIITFFMWIGRIEIYPLLLIVKNVIDRH
ncbi:MAG: TrkH family potassium uptake protein [Candidatus Altiarchaeota archaeon]|nr:TrkH family potassium uptake protein [Candidatus Altiarchaeota archaeon]